MYNHTPIVESESEFIYHKDDLVTLRPGRGHSWFEEFAEWILVKSESSLMMASATNKPTGFHDSSANTMQSLFQSTVQVSPPSTIGVAIFN